MPDSPSSPTPPDGARRHEPVPATGFAWVTGRWARWIVILVWVLALGAVGATGLQSKLADATENESSSFVPKEAESTKATEAIEAIIKTETLPFIAVVSQDEGLTKADIAEIQRTLDQFNRTAPDARLVSQPADEDPRDVTLRDVVPGPKGWLTLVDTSDDGKAAIVVGAVKVTGDSDRLIDSIDALKVGTDQLKREGREVKVTGGAGFSYDASKTLGDLNASLLFAAVILVIVLLILIYRSPILLWLPLIAVMFAEVGSRGLTYLTTEIGVTVSSQSSGIASILVLGAGTDYALLVVSRYREELRHHEDRLDALRLAMHSAGPAVLASGLTVIAGLITLTLASVQSTAGLGPVGAISVGVAMISMLTLLPALFAVVPRGVFWPRTPKYGTTGADATHGFWRSVGERVANNPRRTWVVTGVLLAICVGGLASFNGNLSRSDTFLGNVESVEGSELLAKSFTSGDSAPTQVVVPDPGKVEAVLGALSEVDEVDSAVINARGESGVIINVTLKIDPYSVEANELIPELRRVAKDAGGAAVLTGGETAVQADLAEANDRDLKLIIPIVLIVVFLILIALLRAVVLPLLLISTVVLSFGAAIGLSSLLFDLLGFAGSDRSIVLYGFVFLVALGIDYNIFLASRIREEALRHGTREGVLRGLAATGGVITAAGIVLAGTFLVLASTPVLVLVELGLVVAIGVVIDTFIVRSILVPALALDLGRKIWWPWVAKIPEDGAAEPVTVSPGLSPKQD